MAHLILGQGVSWYFGTSLAPASVAEQVGGGLSLSSNSIPHKPLSVELNASPRVALRPCDNLVLIRRSGALLGGLCRRMNTPGKRRP